MAKQSQLCIHQSLVVRMFLVQERQRQLLTYQLFLKIYLAQLPKLSSSLNPLCECIGFGSGGGGHIINMFYLQSSGSQEHV
ncbi:hypothetical protein XELAEV_18022167mg [Xenopus laevis]|uniref:Uncharacterized protein n=1 Tax=Xenopus laevis TaxID=8355 RepID=A0A974D1W2_XENLA|nr:hypothetical protein XELAEV_18022167mg [Xenopus laevis]